MGNDWETNVQLQVVPKSTQEHNVVEDLKYEWGIAKAAGLTDAEDITKQFKSAFLPANPGPPNDDPLGTESTTLGTSPSTETLGSEALQTIDSVEANIKTGLDIIDNL